MNKILPDLKIIIADDHELFRDGLKLMLSALPEIEIVGEAQNGKELIELTLVQKPDVILTDIKMPFIDGIEATKKILSLNLNPSIIALSMFDENDLIIDMMNAGAKGYLLKNSDKQEIIDAITTVYYGDYYYSKATTNKLTQLIAKSKFIPGQTNKPVFSDKEIQIIECICLGDSTKEISEKLQMSTRTIENIRQRIMDKMEAKNSSSLVAYAMKHKLVNI